MQAVINHVMTICTDAGTMREFVPVENAEPVELSEAEFARLNRARPGCASRFIEADPSNPDGVPDPALDSGSGEPIKFADMTKAELVEFAKSHEIEIVASWTKAEIIEAIQGAQSAGE